MKTDGPKVRRQLFAAMSLAASVAGAPSAPTDGARKPSRAFMRLGLVFAVMGLIAAPLVALAMR